MSQGVSQRGWLLLAVCATLPLMIACLAERRLATDGVLFLRNTLDTDGFFPGADPRGCTFLAAGALGSGEVGQLRSLTDSGAIFGVEMLLPCWLGLAAAWWVLPPARRHFIAQGWSKVRVFRRIFCFPATRANLR